MSNEEMRLQALQLAMSDTLSGTRWVDDIPGLLQCAQSFYDFLNAGNIPVRVHSDGTPVCGDRK